MGTPRADLALAATVGSRVRQVRLSRNLTLTELAEATGVSPQAIARIECGGTNRGSCPSLALAVQLADALDVSLDWITGRDEE